MPGSLPIESLSEMLTRAKLLLFIPSKYNKGLNEIKTLYDKISTIKVYSKKIFSLTTNICTGLRQRKRIKSHNCLSHLLSEEAVNFLISSPS